MSRDEARTHQSRQVLLYAAIGVVVAVMAGLIFWITRDDGDQIAEGDTPTTTTTAAPTTTEPETTTTITEPETTTTEPTTRPDPVDAREAVFPFAEDSLRFDDPNEAVAAFAEGYLGFVDPVYSDFRQGDSRSGEVGLRPTANGPETTVFVRQLDDTWWIIGAASENIVVNQPAAGDVLVSPVDLTGEALAFEGTVNVELWTDRADEPLATTFVTGGGDVLRPFEGTLTFERTPATKSGALLFRVYSPEDGRVWQAGVVRVHF